MLWNSFLQKQVCTSSSQNSCSKQLFEKLPSVLKRDSDMDVLLGSFQKTSEWLFFKMLMDRYFQKFKHPFVENTNGHLSMVEKCETLSKWYWCWITKQKKILRCIGYRCSILFLKKKKMLCIVTIAMICSNLA